MDAQVQHYLVLHCGADCQAKMLWQRICADGQVDAAAGEIEPAALGELAARYLQDKICLLVPGAAVGLYSVQLPGRHNAAGLRALPWLLEEQLACPLEEVNIMPLGSTGQTLWVAVVAQSQLAQWLAPFIAADIQLYKLIPDLLLLPWVEGEITALQWGDRWLLRTGRWQGAQVESSWLPLWLRAWERTHIQPIKVRCYGEPPKGEHWRISPAPDPMALLAYHVLRADSLLSWKKRPSKRPWRMPLIVAMTVLVLLFCQQAAVWWQLAQQGDALQQQLSQQFRQFFPGQPEQRWQAALRRVMQQEDNKGLALWLTPLSALPPGVNIQRLHYRSAPSPAQLQLQLAGDTLRIKDARQLLSTHFNLHDGPDGQLMLSQREAEQ
ncbi:type II secretion system protein GspL [Cedecea colo]|nr:type II secretion system protein GspL [Cedecea colo]